MKKLKKYRIKNQRLLEQVFTHRSYTKGEENNERLEFLGDAVLNLLVADLLMRKRPQAVEGELTEKRSQLVNGKTLAKIATDLDFSNLLKVGTESYRDNDRILAGALEAYIGAFYLENRFSSVKRMIETLFKDTIKQNLPELNYKSILQEWCQKKHKETPLYKLKKEEGLQHKKIFLVDVFIKGKSYGTGSGCQKKQAEQEAAKQALNKLKIPIKEELYAHLI